MRHQAPLTHVEIRRLIPHHGAMCLLQSVLTYGDDTITCETRTHTDPTHPLARDGELPMTAGIEYAAQAMALHAALTAPAAPSKPVRPMLTQLQDVRWEPGPLSAHAGELIVSATRAAQLGGATSYGFTVASGNRTLLEGTALVVRI
jgi:predicted hotdog family 3-hydroxylacyl-ACP dehydratase